MVIGSDDVGVETARIFVVLARCPSADGQRAGTNFSSLHQLAKNRPHPPGTMIGLTKKLTRRLHVGQQVDLVADSLPVANVQLYAYVTRDRDDVRWAVGRAANCRIDHDRILKG